MQGILDTRSFYLTCYSWSLALRLETETIDASMTINTPPVSILRRMTLETQSSMLYHYYGLKLPN